MKIDKLITIFSIFLILFSANSVFPQWTGNTAVNTQVCDTTNDQVLVKIAATVDGGCFIAWFDHRSGGYAVYLQKLNSAGVKQLPSGGVLVSANPQSSSLVDWDMITDDSNNAIIAFTDTRNGSTINPFAYKLNSAGTQMWGANGVTLSDSLTSFQPNPKIAKTSDGNFVFVWRLGQGPTKIAMQKLNPAGIKQWGTSPILLSSGSNVNYDYPALVGTDNGSVIMMWSGYTGTFIVAANYKLYSQKFSSAGTPVWNAAQDTIYSLGNVGGFYTPRIFSDGNNGAVYCWRDDRSSSGLSTGFIQRQNSAGTYLFPVNGSAVSTTAGNNHFDPVAAVSNTGETYAIWMETNSLQSLNGVYGQKFSTSGGRQWTDNGMVFVALNSKQPANMSIYSKNGSMIGYYNELQSGTNYLIKAFIADGNGVLGWGGSILTPCSLLSSKTRLNAVINNAGMSILSWQDNRNDGGGIYAQNINFDGTPIVGITPVSNIVPDKFGLSQNFPNPFNPTTKINFDIASAGDVQLKIYDILGREVALLVNENLHSGSYSVELNAANIPSGIYFYKLTAGNFTETKKMTLIK